MSLKDMTQWELSEELGRRQNLIKEAEFELRSSILELADAREFCEKLETELTFREREAWEKSDGATPQP